MQQRKIECLYKMMTIQKQHLIFIGNRHPKRNRKLTENPSVIHKKKKKKSYSIHITMQNNHIFDLIISFWNVSNS